MKKITQALLIATLATTQWASADTFSERQALLENNRKAGVKAIEVGYNPGTSVAKDQLFFWTNKYWPISNSMIEKTGYSISFIPENDPVVLLNLVRAQHYKWLYVNPNIAVVAQEHGYTPVSYLNRSIESVFVVPTKSMTKTSDLKGKKIATLGNTNESNFAKYYLHIENLQATFIDVGSGGYSELQALLESKQVDAIAVSRTKAVEMVGASNGELKILASAGSAPLAVMLVHTSVTQEQAEKINNSLLTLPLDALKGLPELKFTAKEAIYLPFTKDHLRYTRAALGFVEPDYGRSIYDPKKDQYIESSQAFTEGVVLPILAQPNP